MVHAAYLSRKRRWAGPSGAANPAVRRFPTLTIRPDAPPASIDGDIDLPFSYFTTRSAFAPAANGGALCAF